MTRTRQLPAPVSHLSCWSKDNTNRGWVKGERCQQPRISLFLAKSVRLCGSHLLGQLDADAFAVVADVHPLVGKRRHAPDDVAAEGLVCWLDQVRPINLLVPCRRKVCDNQVAAVVEEPVTIALLALPDNEGGRVRRWSFRNWFDRFPKTFAAW